MSTSDDIYDRPKGLGSKIQNVLVGVLVGMLVLAFAVWGIEDVFSPNSRNAIVKVGENEVSQPQFMDRFNQRMQELAREQGEGLTNQQAFDRGIPQQIVQQMQSDLAIEADAADLGVDVNNRDVRRYVEDIDAFRNEITEEFDEAQLESILRSNRINRDAFESDVVRALTQRQTLPAIMGGIQAPTDYAERFNTFVNEVRTARLIQIDASTLGALPEPTEDAVRSYVAANKARFTSPEYRRVLMLRLDPQDFMGNDPEDPRFANTEDFPPESFDVFVTEEQIRDRFDLLVASGQLGAAETRNVTLLSAPSEEQATMIAARLSAGESAEDVARDLELDAPDRFEEIEEDGLINAKSSEVAFATSAGSAAIAPTDFGSFEVVRVDAVNAGEIPDFAAVKNRLHKELIEGEARGKIADLEKIVDDGLLEGQTIEELAEEIGFPLQAYPYIDRNGVTPDGIVLDGFARLPGIATDANLLNEIFGADIGFESEITPTANNGLAVFRVTDTLDATPKPFEDIKGQATAAVQAEALVETLTAKGIEIAARLRDGEDIDAVASQLGVDVRKVGIQRASPPREFSPSLLVDILSGDPGDVARGQGLSAGTYEIAVLDSVSSSDERIGGQLLNQIRSNVSGEIAADVSQAYSQAVLSAHESQVFEDQLRAALALDDGL